MSNKELQTVTIRQRIFFKMAKDITEYIRDITPSDELIQKLRDRGADIFNLLERKWCHTIPNPAKSWAKTQDNIALFHVTTYEEWLRIVGKKTQHDSQSRKAGQGQMLPNQTKNWLRAYGKSTMKYQNGKKGVSNLTESPCTKQ